MLCWVPGIQSKRDKISQQWGCRRIGTVTCEVCTGYPKVVAMACSLLPFHITNSDSHSTKYWWRLVHAKHPLHSSQWVSRLSKESPSKVLLLEDSKLSLTKTFQEGVKSIIFILIKIHHRQLVWAFCIQKNQHDQSFSETQKNNLSCFI